MKNSFLLFYLATFSLFSQNSVQLNSVSFTFENPGFYIESIIDDRAKKHLGIHRNKDGEKAPLRLYPDPVAALTSFIKPSIPKNKLGKGIVMKIKELNIQDSRVNETEVIARAYIHLVFYAKEGNRLIERYQIQHYEDQLFEVSILELRHAEEVFDTHEKRIRAALEYCLLAFAENQRKGDESTMTHFDGVGRVSENEKLLKQWYNIISYRQLLTSTYHEGWALGYMGFMDDDRRFIIPYELNFEQYRVKEDFAREEGFEYVDSYVLRPGLFGYKKILPGVYAALGVNLPVGVEVLKALEGDESYRFLIGVGASQGIQIIPWKQFGVVIGVEFFQQVQNSEIYKTDVGLELSIGINF